jgi:hypothetical protein
MHYPDSTTTITGTEITGSKRLTAKQKYDLIKRLIAEHPGLDNYEIGKLAHARWETVHFVRSIAETVRGWKRAGAGEA